MSDMGFSLWTRNQNARLAEYFKVSERLCPEYVLQRLSAPALVAEVAQVGGGELLGVRVCEGVLAQPA